MSRAIKYLFFIYLFLLPFQTRYIYQQGILNPSLPSPQMGGNIAWEYGTLSLYATEILLAVILILYIIGFIRAYTSRQSLPKGTLTENTKKNLKNPLIALPLALLFWSALTILWSYDKMLAWNRCIILMEGIIVYLILISNFKFQISKKIQNFNTQNYKKNIFSDMAIMPLIIGAILQSALAIYQFFAQQIIANKWLGIASHLPEALGTSVVETSLRRWLRAYGSLPHPNILAAYLGIAFLIFIFFAFKKFTEKNQRKNLTNIEELKERGLGIIKVFAIFLISIAIIFTFSRAVWIGLFLSVIMFLVFNKFKIKNLPAIPSFGFFILFMVILFLAREPILARITGTNRLEKKTNQEHILSYKEGIDIIKENWLGGVGIGNYTYAAYKKNQNLPAYSYQPVHNLFMLIFSELGIFGLFIFLLFLFYVAKKLIASFKPELAGTLAIEKNYFILPSRQSLPEGTLTIKEKNYFIILFIFMLLISLFDHYFWSLYFGVILFWLSLGIVVSDNFIILKK